MVQPPHLFRLLSCQICNHRNGEHGQDGGQSNAFGRYPSVCGAIFLLNQHNHAAHRHCNQKNKNSIRNLVNRQYSHKRYADCRYDQKADKGKEKLLFVCYQDFKSDWATMMPTVIMDKGTAAFPMLSTKSAAGSGTRM